MTHIDDTILAGKHHIHFIGVGGSGMFPIVQILLSQGYAISGSDNNPGETLDAEQAMGVTVYMGQRPENLKGAELVVYSAAIMEDNPELVAARQMGVPVVERSEMLGLLTRHYSDCICVSGTHGKTTTTAMLTQILYGAGLDPTAVIGGKLPAIGGSGRAGSSSIMTCEACEFVDTFLHLAPDYAVILNVDADHLDYFGTLENIIKSFHKFAGMATKAILYNGDDPNTCKAVEGLDQPKTTFGWREDNDFYPANIVQKGGVKCGFDLMCRGENLGHIELNVPGRHNILNAVAAAAAALAVGATPAQIQEHLPQFRGAHRRFEVLGQVNGVTIADDYAHHPAELKVTLEAAKEMDFNRVWAVFQPFTYSRTALLLEDFAKVLPIADRVVLSAIMGAREVNTYGIYAKDLADKIPGCVWFETFPEIARYVIQEAQPGDLVITLGCGDVYKCAHMMLGE
ncbi:UDP-N-acetylmuramate--L-alanine ligase [Merdimmobilis hominis]|uniref:UDP-N-acetylmuramate--L-alanine ligase n=1 Tax=Merdimmobilis hominis TaxID=2897707 RepID=UPI0008F8D1FC|nr:UDP-N-acetylmuramate--L-alanine ligase [Merdimmobilis hominis]PWL60369.1 MAG: UDP-N-acetylmuramate--L-alanine ligase [Oscillospiraceae bacterium]